MYALAQANYKPEDNSTCSQALFFETDQDTASSRDDDLATIPNCFSGRVLIFFNSG
jgi:hypothetical protein